MSEPIRYAPEYYCYRFQLGCVCVLLVFRAQSDRVFCQYVIRSSATDVAHNAAHAYYAVSRRCACRDEHLSHAAGLGHVVACVLMSHWMCLKWIEGRVIQNEQQ
ncbi:hypothetical protein FOPG_18523 [Fusarium oxysporum f. sp. conglutinans race 2 54008]|uniref:Uncharacterized protein n=1 Tax=Fusarium oxysporum f. sp. conglutinans race 2 54008 TaxID=1089457 RepID=X0GNN7_FUSOX|nr:hypothetical protein FOPG_18523 [Fusarium oxysporum f. sp. conglutinans race 2 54008]